MTASQQWWGIFVAAAVICGYPAIASKACNDHLPTGTMIIGGYRLQVEIAADPSARICGLSGRMSMPEETGMLFIFPTPSRPSFWMKDTKIPLSIAFIDDNDRIVSIQDMAPMQTDALYCPPDPVRYAVEVNMGWFARRGVAIGDAVDLRIPSTLNVR
jgi:uncharacterized membrane protein (UPF0127 family)